MQNGWTTTKLGDHIQTLKGYAFKSEWYSDNGVPLVKVSDFTGDAIDTTRLMRVPNEIAVNYSKYELKTDDVVIQTVGSWPTNPQSVVGKVIRVPRKANRALLNQNAVKIIPDESIDKKFLFYALRSSSFKNYIIGCAQGAASQASITLDAIRKYDFSFPKLGHQRRIAASLAVYDDLIENNTRRIQILEEMAQRIYEEWFVRFRFPGHENIRMVESELGLIPVEWEISRVADTFDVLGGGTPPTSLEEYWHSGTINWYTPTDLTRSGRVFIDESGDKITQLGLAKSSARLFPAFSVMMTSRATLGVIAINTTQACTNQGFINCIPSERFPLYVLFHWLRQNVGLFISLATGATFKEITKGNFKQIKLLVPPAILTNRFHNLLQPMMQQLLNLQRKNSTLSRTRDLLLPKLISGEIDVSNFPEPE